MSKDAEIAAAIIIAATSPSETGRDLNDANLVDGLFAISRSIRALASSIDRLGVADAATPLGALELLSMEVKNGAAAIAQALEQR